MKTTILTIAIALASALSALAQTVMRENSTVYFQTNVFLHDDPTNALHTRIVEGQEPLWIAASNQVAYYQSSGMTNASIHARYLYSTNATLTNANIHASALRIDGTNMVIGLLESWAVLNLTEGMKLTGATASGTTNRIESINDGQHIEIKAAGGSANSGGQVLLTPGLRYGTPSKVRVTAGKFEADDIKTIRIYFTDSGAPVFSSWLESDGTNLFFISTVPPGFTNALTTNAP